MSELLSPAGNFQKLKAALLYGADAVYCAGKCFGMRSAADNFEIEELYQAAKYTHERGKKIYLTLNTLPSWHEYQRLEQFLNELKDCGLDAFIVADPGVFATVKRVLPHAEIHISTQAGAHSHEDCNFWHSMGASRIVLARETTLADI